MRTSKKRKVVLAVSLMMALVMLFGLASVSYASSANYGGDTDGGDDGLVCVDGYVINHREEPVDGTEFSPQLRVWALGIPSGIATSALADISAASDALATLDAMEEPSDEEVDAAGMQALEALSTDEVSAAGLLPKIRWAKVGDDGYFEFEELETDYQWVFVMKLPTDWDGIVPHQETRGGLAATGWTMLDERDDDGCYHIVFKIRRLFDITVIKWEELLDGSVQPGTGWDIKFIPVDDPFAEECKVTTNGSGGAVCTLTPGDWYVIEHVKADWHPVTPPKIHLELDQYAPPGAMDPVVFKNRQPPCTGEIVVEKTGLGRDANGGLVWLGPLAGWKIRVYRADGKGHVMHGETDASGRATFDDLYPGVYKVEEYVQKGWKAISDNPQVVLVKGCETHRVLFENEEIAGKLSIHGRKLFRAWVPPFKGKEVGLSGWEITATLVGTDMSVSTTTNALGEFWFGEGLLKETMIGFPGATVKVCEEDRDHWIHVSPECVTVTFPYPVPDDYEGEYVEFINVQDPPVEGASASATVSSGAACRATYTVQAGDSLYGIAARNGSTVSAIAQANGITNINYIRYGTSMCIP